MKILRVKDLKDVTEGHIFEDILIGKEVYIGGLAFLKKGERSHSHLEAPELDQHIHDDCEAFTIIQGHNEWH